jgi:hypothetical protein
MPDVANDRSRLLVAIIVGFAAGIIATAAQMFLWWLTAVPLFETLYRDARLTAAIVMEISGLPPASQWGILIVASLIHFGLSIAYAVIPAHFAGRMRTGPVLLAGFAYGLAIYGVDLYGFAVIFPWFAIARGWVTILTHVIFGIALAGGCKLLSRTRGTQTDSLV